MSRRSVSKGVQSATFAMLWPKLSINSICTAVPPSSADATLAHLGVVVAHLGRKLSGGSAQQIGLRRFLGRRRLLAPLSASALTPPSSLPRLLAGAVLPSAPRLARPPFGGRFGGADGGAALAQTVVVPRRIDEQRILRQVAGPFHRLLGKRVGDGRLALLIHFDVVAAVVPQNAVLDDELGVPRHLDGVAFDHRGGGVVGNRDVVQGEGGADAVFVAVDVDRGLPRRPAWSCCRRRDRDPSRPRRPHRRRSQLPSEGAKLPVKTLWESL